jgi:hypothetical protein
MQAFLLCSKQAYTQVFSTAFELRGADLPFFDARENFVEKKGGIFLVKMFYC